MDSYSDSQNSSCPFPLKEFKMEKDHQKYFFGRERQIEALIAKIRNENIVSLVGRPKIGKTSLVNCGIIPTLKNGYNAKFGNKWKIVVFDIASPKSFKEQLKNRLLFHNSRWVKRDEAYSFDKDFQNLVSKTQSENFDLKRNQRIKQRLDDTSNEASYALIDIYANNESLKQYNTLFVLDFDINLKIETENQKEKNKEKEKIVEKIKKSLLEVFPLLKSAADDVKTPVYFLMIIDSKTFKTLKSEGEWKDILSNPFYIHNLAEQDLRTVIEEQFNKLNPSIKLEEKLILDIIKGLKHRTASENQLVELQKRLTEIWRKWEKHKPTSPLLLKDFRQEASRKSKSINDETRKSNSKINIKDNNKPKITPKRSKITIKNNN